MSLQYAVFVRYIVLVLALMSVVVYCPNLVDRFIGLVCWLHMLSWYISQVFRFDTLSLCTLLGQAAKYRRQQGMLTQHAALLPVSPAVHRQGPSPGRSAAATCAGGVPPSSSFTVSRNFIFSREFSSYWTLLLQRIRLLLLLFLVLLLTPLVFRDAALAERTQREFQCFWYTGYYSIACHSAELGIPIS